jgi:hypothetical protein
VFAYAQTGATVRDNVTPTLSLYTDLISWATSSGMCADNMNRLLTLENVGCGFDVSLWMACKETIPGHKELLGAATNECG